MGDVTDSKEIPEATQLPVAEVETLRLALNEAISWARRPSPIPIVAFNEFLERMGKLGAGPRAGNG